LLELPTRGVSKEPVKEFIAEITIKRRTPPKGERMPPFTTFVVPMFTTEGFTLSARSANDPGALVLSPGDTAEAVCTSVPVGTRKEDRSTSTTETMKKPIRQARRNMKKVLRFLFSMNLMHPPKFFIIYNRAIMKTLFTFSILWAAPYHTSWGNSIFMTEVL